MENINSKRLVAYQKNPYLSLLAWFLFIIGSMAVAVELSNLFLKSTIDLSQSELLNLSSEETLDAKTKFVILLAQGISSLITFILPAVLFFIFYNRININELFGDYVRHSKSYLLTIFILMSFFVANTFFIELNAKMTLPESFAELEKIIKTLEEQLKEFTKLLTQFDTPLYFILSVIIIAIIPAIGEELIFRGLFQNIIRQIFGNYHAAVWIAAFIFSAIHFQFYGFLPRMLLGVLFGYLYVWSGNLWIPILAHFLNNFISLTLLYIYQLNLTDIDVESEESLPIWTIIIFSILFIFLLYSFRKYFSEISNRHDRLEESI